MISDFDLLDLGSCFKALRFDITNDKNIAVVEKLLCVLKSDKIDDVNNKFRNALRGIRHLNKKQWWFIYHKNVYVTYRFVKNSDIYTLFIQACEELLWVLKEKNFKRADALVDAVHNLPEIIFFEKLSIPSCLHEQIANYQKTWGSISNKPWIISHL